MEFSEAQDFSYPLLAPLQITAEFLCCDQKGKACLLNKLSFSFICKLICVYVLIYNFVVSILSNALAENCPKAARVCFGFYGLFNNDDFMEFSCNFTGQPDI